MYGVGKTTIVPAKRPADVDATARPLKTLKMSDLIEEEGPRPQQPSARKLSAKNPVQVVVHKYTDCAGSKSSWKPFVPNYVANNMHSSAPLPAFGLVPLN